MASVLPETRRGPERPGGRRAGPPALAAARARRQVRDRHDPKRIRYGCFLPDLTGLATASPTPAPRRGYIRSLGGTYKGKAGMNAPPILTAISIACLTPSQRLFGLQPAPPSDV